MGITKKSSTASHTIRFHFAASHHQYTAACLSASLPLCRPTSRPPCLTTLRLPTCLPPRFTTMGVYRYIVGFTMNKSKLWIRETLLGKPRAFLVEKLSARVSRGCTTTLQDMIRSVQPQHRPSRFRTVFRWCSNTVYPHFRAQSHADWRRRIRLS